MSDGKNSKDVKAQNCECGSAGQLNDPVNHPAHYTTGKIEVIDYIEDQKLPYHLGNAVKYISRAGKKDKDKTVEDLKKAVWYIQRYIGLISGKADTTTVDGAADVVEDAANGSNSSDAADDQCISPALSENFINTEIFIDFDSELIYGEDQAYICCPKRFPTVRFQLKPTRGLIQIADGIRHKLGFKPMYLAQGCEGKYCDECADFLDCNDIDCDGWYDFFISLNGLNESHLDTCIAVVVAGSDSPDNEDMYTIDLSEDEQKMLYKRFDEQCRKNIDKTCEELLKEAEDMME